MTKPKRYEITTIADIAEKIPTRSLSAFFAELHALIEAKHAIDKLAVANGDKPAATVHPYLWIDDGKFDLTFVMNELGMNQQYITERWNVSKDDIYAALDALLVARIYVKYSVESNPRFQQVKNNDMKMVDSAIQKLKQYPKDPASE